MECWFADSVLLQWPQDLTGRQVDEFTTKVFEFNDRLEQNPDRTMKPFTVCSMRHGGLCCLDPCSSKGDIGTKNVYNRLWSLKKDLPLFVRLAIPVPLCSTDQFVGKIHGRGDAVLFVEHRFFVLFDQHLFFC